MTETESPLVAHARTEMALLGETDLDFIDMVVNVVAAFTEYGHSGGSASVAIPMINDLLQWKNLTELTNNPDEWLDQSGASGGNAIWQSKRNPEAFSKDGGKTYYLLSETQMVHTSVVALGS